MDTLSKIPFGQRLKAFRIQSKWPTATAFAEAAGISRATLYLWEAAPDPPPAKHWPRLCSILGISESHLLLGSAQTSSSTSNAVQEGRTPYGQNPMKVELENKIREALDWAGDDSARLAILLAQLYWAMQGERKRSDDPHVREAIEAAHKNPFRTHDSVEGAGNPLKQSVSSKR